MISTSSLFFIFHIIVLNINQVNNQNKIQPNTIEENFHIHSKMVKYEISHHSNINHNIIINNVTAVQSLNKLSH
jgi:hypothetical protein